MNDTKEVWNAAGCLFFSKECHWQANSKQFQKMCNYVPHSVVLILSAVEVFQGWGSAWAEVDKEASWKTVLRQRSEDVLI